MSQFHQTAGVLGLLWMDASCERLWSTFGVTLLWLDENPLPQPSRTFIYHPPTARVSECQFFTLDDKFRKKIYPQNELTATDFFAAKCEKV